MSLVAVEPTATLPTVLVAVEPTGVLRSLTVYALAQW